MEQITTLTRLALREIDAEIIAALTPIMEKHGLTVALDGGTFDPNTHYTAKVKMQLVSDVGVPADFAKMAPMYGLEADDYGKIITLNHGKRAKISGINPNSPKYPISLTELGTGKRWKVPADTVLRQFHPDKKTVFG